MFVTFTLDNFRITQTRSLHNDTDYVYISVTVGADPTVFNWKRIGDVNNGTHEVGLRVEADIPNDDTPVVFIYGIVNNSHSNNDAVEKTITTAFSSMATAIVKNKEATAEISIATTAGLAVIPLVGSTVAGLAVLVTAVAGIGAILFADCDGAVASGTLLFSAAELIRRTASGQKITDTVQHHGTNSPHFCNHSNSEYETTVTLTTTASIQTVIDLNGEWEGGGVPGPFITRTGNSISIDMSASHRPTAAGTILNSSRISVKFPDDKTIYTGTLQAPNVINEQLELEQGPGDRDPVRSQRQMDERRRARPGHHRARQFDRDRHVGDPPPGGVRLRHRRLAHLGQISRRQVVYRDAREARRAQMVGQFGVDEVRRGQDQAPVRADAGEPVVRSHAGIFGHQRNGRRDRSAEDRRWPDRKGNQRLRVR